MIAGTASTLLLAAASLALASTVGPAAAVRIPQSAGDLNSATGEAPLCAERQLLIRVLVEKHGESPQTVEPVGGGLTLELYSSDKSFTYFLSNDDGFACVVLTATR